MGKSQELWDICAKQPACLVLCIPAVFYIWVYFVGNCKLFTLENQNEKWAYSENKACGKATLQKGTGSLVFPSLKEPSCSKFITGSNLRAPSFAKSRTFFKKCTIMWRAIQWLGCQSSPHDMKQLHISFINWKKILLHRLKTWIIIKGGIRADSSVMFHSSPHTWTVRAKSSNSNADLKSCPSLMIA